MAYTVPDPATLKATYPAFASVDNATIQIWLDRVSGSSGSGGDVDTSWIEGDYANAIMAAAAHKMAELGIGTQSGAAGGAAAGISSFKSGTVDIAFSADAIKQAVTGGWESTVYGREYVRLLNRSKAGPRVVAGGYVPVCGFGRPWFG